MNTLFGFAALLALWWLGDAIRLALGLPIPGAVIGMVLRFLLAVIRGGMPHFVADCADGLLRHLALLFVPAGVGIMLYGDALLAAWAPLLLAWSGTLLTSLLTTATVMAALVRWRQRRRAHTAEAAHDLA